MAKRWLVAEPCPSDFPASVGLASPIVAQLFWNRGLRSKEEVQAFLEPIWETGVHDPARFSQMTNTVARIFRALEAGERITVHGDYDADGVTGSTVIITTLREMEKRMRASGSTEDSMIDFYIPHRDKEGYGLRNETISLLKERGTGLIITVDCGIACVEEIAFAKRVSIDTIVVDHHQFGATLPDGLLIHPGIPEETYPFKQLAAVGVAYKLACALLAEARRRGQDIPEGWEKWLLDLVAIATVTDMVPLVGENRVLETYGLRVLNKARRPGLKAIMAAAGLEPGTVNAESIGFAIGPRLNAAGRMDHASLALRLLLSESEEEARVLAAELEGRNRERQEATRRMMDEAEKKMETEKTPSLLMLWDERWSPSLVGLLAGRFVERYGRPVVVAGFHEGRWIGSGRSLPAYDITAAMKESGEGLLARCGGHVQACGFSMQSGEHLPALSDRLVAHAEQRLHPDDLVPIVSVDAEIPLASVQWPLVETLERFAPFGEGNREPVFLSRGCYVAQARTIGSTGNHLRLTLVAPDGERLQAIGFKMGSRLSEIPMGSFVDLVYNASINAWNGRRDLQCKLIDFQTVSSSI